MLFNNKALLEMSQNIFTVFGFYYPWIQNPGSRINYSGDKK